MHFGCGQLSIHTQAYILLMCRWQSSKMPARVVSFHTLYHKRSRLVAAPEVKDNTSEVGRPIIRHSNQQPHALQGCSSSVYLTQRQQPMIWLKLPDDTWMEVKLWVICKEVKVLKGRRLCLPNGSNKNRCHCSTISGGLPKYNGNIDRRLAVVDVS